jgi:hypothetical protein
MGGVILRWNGSAWNVSHSASGGPRRIARGAGCLRVAWAVGSWGRAMLR